MIRKRWILRILLAGIVSTGLVAYLLWSQEGELRVAEKRLSAGDTSGAIESVDRFLQVNPNHSRAIRLRARALVAQGKADQALELFGEIGADRPEDLRAWAKAYIAIGQFEPAARILESLSKLEKLDAEAFELLGVCQFNLGMREPALASARQLAELPGHEATGHLQLALFYNDWGAAALSLEHLEEVVKYRPDATGLRLSPAEFFGMYGFKLLQSGKTQKALEALHQSERLNPTPDNLLLQAEAQRILGNVQQAKALIDRFVRQYPRHPASQQLATPSPPQQTPDPSGKKSDSTATVANAAATAPKGSSNRPVSSEINMDGHSRMLKLLEEIKARTPDENPYLGDGPVRDFKQQLERMSNDTDVAKRFDLLNKLAVKQLQMGRTEEAIELFQQCLGLVPQGASDLSDRVEYQLGIAYLRRAENENCVHCANGQSCIVPIRGAGVHQMRSGSENAVKQFKGILDRNPEHVAARWLLNLAHMTLGEYPDKVSDKFRIPPERFAAEAECPWFPNISQTLQLDHSSLAGGMVVDDINGDGRLDVVMSQWSTDGQIRSFLQSADGKFVESTSEAGLNGLYGGLNLVQSDFDNDGDIDILVLRGGWWGDAGRHPKSLLANDGTGRFRDVTFDVGLGEVHYPTQTAGWADYDNDGDLDLFVGNEGFPCQLFRNNGLGRFKDVARAAGVDDGGYAKGVTWGDYDNDRFPDLYVSNLEGANRLFHNNRDGTFTNVAIAAGVKDPSRSFPTWFWDFNNDGALDLFVGAYTANIAVFASDFLGLPHQGETDRLYQGDGQGGFRDVSRECNLARATIPMGSNFGDLDNDGFLDFYLGTGDPNFDSLMPNRMYRNQGGKRFADVSTSGGFAHLQKGHGVAFADFDHDGDQDVFIKMGGAFPGDAFPSAVFQNPGFGNHWLGIKLVGQTSNRMGIGARIHAIVAEGGASRSIYRWMNSGGSFGANPLRVHLGLGTATLVKSLEVWWPTSDTSQKFENIPADQLIQITEGREGTTFVPIIPSNQVHKRSSID